MQNRLKGGGMNERYSVLRPLEMNELEFITFELISFFSPMKLSEIRQLLGKPVEQGRLISLSVNDFFNFMGK